MEFIVCWLPYQYKNRFLGLNNQPFSRPWGYIWRQLPLFSQVLVRKDRQGWKCRRRVFSTTQAEAKWFLHREKWMKCIRTCIWDFWSQGTIAVILYNCEEKSFAFSFVFLVLKPFTRFFIIHFSLFFLFYNWFFIYFSINNQKPNPHLADTIGTCLGLLLLASNYWGHFTQLYSTLIFDKTFPSQFYPGQRTYHMYVLKSLEI